MRGIGKSQENSTIFPLFFQQAVSKESPTSASGGGIASRTAFFSSHSRFLLRFLCVLLLQRALFIKYLQYKMAEKGKTAELVPYMVFLMCYNSGNRKIGRKIAERYAEVYHFVRAFGTSVSRKMVRKETPPDGNGKNAEDTDLSG